MSAQELFKIALSWTDGDAERAALLVDAWIRGDVDGGLSCLR